MPIGDAGVTGLTCWPITKTFKSNYSRGWHYDIGNELAVCNASIPFAGWFMSWLTYFQSSCLGKQQKVEKVAWVFGIPYLCERPGRSFWIGPAPAFATICTVNQLGEGLSLSLPPCNCLIFFYSFMMWFHRHKGSPLYPRSHPNSAFQIKEATSLKIILK